MKTRKSIYSAVFVIIALVFVNECHGQDLQYEIGVKSGINYSDLSSGTDYRYGYHGGLFIYGVINPQFRFGTELQYSNQGAILPNDIVLKCNYLSMAFIGKVNPVKDFGLSLHAGLQFGYLMNTKIEFDKTEVENHPYSSEDLGLAAGVGYGIKRTEVSLRYTHSVSELENRLFQLSVYYTIFNQSIK